MKKQLKELTIKDNFMFGAVMTMPENCKDFLEMVLQTKLSEVVVSKEKSMIYHPEYKGIRLDVYANDEERTHYNVEMQVSKKPALGRRSRYYQSQIDMELLVSGEEYEELPDTYVIFLCDFDPFGQKKYRYTFSSGCKECKESKLQDGRCTIFLSTHGENEDEVPKELVTFLRFVKAGLQESEQNFHDDYVEKLQRTIREIKRDREMEERFMILEEMLKDERKEGRIEGREEGRAEGARLSLCTILECKGRIPDMFRKQIETEQNLEVLRNWLVLAAKSDTMEAFLAEAESVKGRQCGQKE